MNLLFEECKIQALASRLERLKGNYVKGCRLIGSKKATECRTPAQREKIVR